MSNRKKDAEYQRWAKAVKDKNGGRCTICGSTDGVVAHHIVPYSIDKENRANVDNGIPLCSRHHKMAHLAPDVCHKGRAKAPVINDEEIVDGIVGMYVHIFDNEGYVKYQGRIIGKENSVYIVQMFEFVIGLESTIWLFNSEFIYQERRVNLYRTSDEMKYWFEYKAQRYVPDREKNTDWEAFFQTLEKKWVEEKEDEEI